MKKPRWSSPTHGSSMDPDNMAQKSPEDKIRKPDQLYRQTKIFKCSQTGKNKSWSRLWK